MGILDGALDAVSDAISTRKNKKRMKRRRQLQTVEVKVRMDCEGCEKKVRESVKGMKGVTEVRVEPKMNKLAVTGFVEPAKVVKRVARKTGKKAELWPYVPYALVDHPYVPGAYDRKAPPGHVRSAAVLKPDVAALARAGSDENRFVSAFSDENPNACAVM
ncbi:heavy metal-associated isoprenylated plant protein 27-like [Wolffia australiana]